MSLSYENDAAWHCEMVDLYYQRQAVANLTGSSFYVFGYSSDPRPHAEGSCRCPSKGFITREDQDRDIEFNRAWADAGYPPPGSMTLRSALLSAGTIRPHGKYIRSTRKTRGCMDGRSAHTYVNQRCAPCGDDRGESSNCWSFNCGTDADYEYSRFVDEVPNSYHEYEWKAPRRKVATDYGVCEWCIEKYRRADEGLRIRTAKAIAAGQQIAAVRRRYEERDAQRQEKEMQWQAARATRQEKARQRAHLREGHQTLTAIRRLLRGADRSPQQESRPAKTSQTS